MGGNVLRKRIRDHLFAICSFDAACIRTVDPNNLLTTGAFTDESVEAIHQQLFENEYLEQDIHSHQELVNALLPVQLLHDKPSRRLDEILLPAGFRDEMRIAFVVNDTCYGFASLFRKNMSFSNDEVQKITKHVKKIAQMMRSHMEKAPQMSFNESIKPMIIFSERLDILFQNSEGEQWLQELCTEEAISTDRLPRSIRAVAYQMLSEQTTHHRTIMKTQAAQIYAMEASLLTGNDEANVLMVMRVPMSEEARFSHLVTCYRLTSKESQILEHVWKGHSTKEIAQQLSISPYTVQDHLKSIFSKTNMNSRSKLIQLLR
ncbi:helix-turn-helix transcriptional regulator [Gracilibacillus orientalis]|uniref:helix-turn-helix transcriptional regulator n=1 Tax=Gracilibacillus orientalis TaxID=334253 RepID=UPI000B84EC6A|nr:helix-turn-helix transcriptional regulator [Gracilibacillus orientalis]